MFFAKPPALHRHGLHFLPNQETRAFIKTHDGVERIIRLWIQPQDLLHMSEEVSVDLPETPRFLEMRLQFVFLERFLPACGRCGRNSRVPPLSPPAAAGSTVHSPEELRGRPVP